MTRDGAVSALVAHAGGCLMGVAQDRATVANLIVGTLQAAVPLRIHELATLTPALRANVMRAWAANAVDPLASRGDILQYGGKKGEAADVFNHLARGVAVLASNRGGARLFDLMWCAEHSPAGAGPTTDVVCGRCLGTEAARAVTTVDTGGLT